jgi:hypothetical protein
MKTGIGAWELDNGTTALTRVAGLGVGWYYTWKSQPLRGTAPLEFIPMVWSASGPFSGLPGKTVLGFNEPDNKHQANMSVSAATTQWKKLTAQPKLRLGSPAPTQGQTFGVNAWLTKFLAVNHACFVAAHFYSPDLSVEGLRRFLLSTYAAHGLPIWLTEWAGVIPETWTTNVPAFTMSQQAQFFIDAAEMMETLPFLERHAWFAAFGGGDGWNLNCHAIEANGTLSPVGLAIRQIAAGY